jgi:4-diphosphocytidyl-2C-methyl-D-erythritol kinase
MERLKAYSKVNLILKVFPKLKNESKHRIHSLFCLYQSLYDDIQIEESTTTRIVFIRYNKKINIDSTKILLAIDYLSKLLKRTIFLNIIINKKIPVMAGLGGSATDVATIIK